MNDPTSLPIPITLPEPTRSLADRILRLEQLEVLRAAVYQIEDSIQGAGRGLILGPSDQNILVAKRQEAMEKLGVLIRSIVADVQADAEAKQRAAGAPNGAGKVQPS